MTCRELRVAVEIIIDTGRRPEEICRLELDCLNRDGRAAPSWSTATGRSSGSGGELPIHEATAELIRDQQDGSGPASRPARVEAGAAAVTGDEPATGQVLRLQHLSGRHREWVTALPELHPTTAPTSTRRRSSPTPTGTPTPSATRTPASRSTSWPNFSIIDSYESTRCYYRVKEVRLREAVDKVTAMQFDRHGSASGASGHHASGRRTRPHAIGSVVVPFGTCSEPSNVAAGGGACPLRFRCVGCDHFSTDVSYLPELAAYLDDLLRTGNGCRR